MPHFLAIRRTIQIGNTQFAENASIEDMNSSSHVDQVVLISLPTVPAILAHNVKNIVWRVLISSWWLQMVHQERQWVLSCTHFQTTNIINHLSSGLINMLDLADPFGILFMDVWSPSEVPTEKGDTKQLFSMEEVTVFVGGTSLK